MNWMTLEVPGKILAEWWIHPPRFKFIGPLIITWPQMTPRSPQLTAEVLYKILLWIVTTPTKFQVHIMTLYTNMTPGPRWPQMTLEVPVKNPLWMMTTPTKFHVHITLYSTMTPDDLRMTAEFNQLFEMWRRSHPPSTIIIWLVELETSHSQDFFRKNE